MSSFRSRLRVEPIDDHNWIILEDFTYYIGNRDSNRHVNVRSGYVTDFASTPQFLWSILPPWGDYGKAAVVHDWLCDKRVISEIQQDGTHKEVEISRKEADNIFLEAMAVLGVHPIKRYAMYLGVRAYGILLRK